jgi:hypothetical protein
LRIKKLPETLKRHLTITIEETTILKIIIITTTEETKIIKGITIKEKKIIIIKIKKNSNKEKNKMKI